ncbi:hypothetical protein D9611_008127 [Ephemerocybe angulata]|uniref:SnoaL-like domain-containing protein n=1 Tax=Ephemerocybe angulata TaxID=980116 RepID=A0A8H5BZE3_9AGAR|nr:hypothetical protein D9611_008127 [Tulosesus angulatus]
MRFFHSTLATALSILAFANVMETLASPPVGAVCNPNAPPGNLEKRQQEALADFARLFLAQKNVQAAFDKYIPGQYIQHSPAVAQSGRQVALDFLIPSLADPGFSTSNLKAFAGEGYGILHYKMNLFGGLGATGGISLAVADIFRFQGTCIVEHWDVLQQIQGNEANPIAFF